MVASGPAGTDKPVNLFVKTALFAWSGGDAEQKVDRVGCVIKKVYRARGSTGLAAQPLAGEKELGRFVAQHLHMVAMVGSDGKLADEPVWSGTFRLACEGGGELLLTDRRLLITVILGETVLGDVNERNGKIFVIDIPYGVITSVDVMRKKAFFGGMKVKAIRVQSITPPTVLDVEPIAQLDSSWVVAAKASYQTFADTLVMAACDHALADPGLTPTERRRLADLRAGDRVIELFRVTVRDAV